MESVAFFPVQAAAAMPPAFFGFSVLFFFIPILAWIASAAWVTWDSLQRTGEWGFLWGFLAFGCAPVVVPLYLLTTYKVDRPAPAWVQREREYEKEQVTKYKGMTEFDRVRFLEASAGGVGTLYAGPGLRPSENGAKLFTDAHAEGLLGAKQYDEAFIYLYDLYALALEESDPRAEQTYKYYITQVPQGLDLLKRARDRGVSPGMLKAGGMSLIESFVPAAQNRPRPVSTDPATAAQHRAPAEAVPAGQSLEQLLNAQEPAPPPSPVRNSQVQPPRPAKPTGRNPKVPF
jgi:hypothetical protein